MMRVAIVGAGGMAKAHAGCYANIPGAKVVGVCDIRPDAAESLASAHGAQAFGDLDSMLKAAKPDLVDVCVPTPWHAEYVLEAARAGLKGIVVEKPMARTVEQCDEIIAACNRGGVPLFVAHVLRFFPEFAAAREQVLAGAVGTPVTVRTRRGGPFPRAWENWYGRPDWSGGCILDLIIHDFDWLRWTFGDVERVYAKGLVGAAAPGQEMERDYALVTLRFRSGVIGHVEGTWADPGGFKVAFEVAGTEGLLEFNFNQPAGVPYVAAVQSSGGTGPGVAVPESPVAVSPYQLELEHFLNALETGTAPCVTPEDGREAVRIALAALESIETGAPVTL